jgi:flagellar biosynthetic protein FliR
VFATNTHHRLLAALVDSYAAVPVGLGAVNPSLVDSVSRMLGLVFVIGVRIAAPIIVVLLVVELALGLAGRVAPALNVMMSGAPIRLAIGLLVAAATVQTIPPIVERYVPVALTLAADTVRSFK